MKDAITHRHTPGERVKMVRAHRSRTCYQYPPGCQVQVVRVPEVRYEIPRLLLGDYIGKAGTKLTSILSFRRERDELCLADYDCGRSTEFDVQG